MNRWLTCLLLCGGLAGENFPAAHAQNEAVARADRVLVRSRPSLKGEVVTRLERGQRVLVFEEGLPPLLAGDTVTEWVRIELPAGARVWVAAEYVDPAGGVVLARLLNVRAGPSEDYAVLGRVARGAKLSVVGGTNGWLEVLAPPGLSGYVAAHLLEPSPPRPAPSPEPAAPEPTPPPREAAPAGAAPPQESPAPKTPPAETPPATVPPGPAADPEVPPASETPRHPAPATLPPPAPSPTTPPPVADAAAEPAALPPARRVVQREGIVRATRSIQAPTWYELRGTDTGARLNYLLPADPGPDLRPFRGKRVRVTGEEFLDAGWATPLLRVEKILLTE
jgi:hypothetical protein